MIIFAAMFSIFFTFCCLIFKKMLWKCWPWTAKLLCCSCQTEEKNVPKLSLKKLTCSCSRSSAQPHFLFLFTGDREAGGGESRPAEGDWKPAEGERQAGVHAGRPQPCVQAPHRRAPPAVRAPAAPAAVHPPAPDHAPQHGNPGSNEPSGREARAGGWRGGAGQAPALRHQAHLPGWRRRQRRDVLHRWRQPEHAGGGGVHPGRHTQRPESHIHLPEHAGARKPLTLLRVLLQGPPAQQQQRRPVLRLPQLAHPPGPLSEGSARHSWETNTVAEGKHEDQLCAPPPPPVSLKDQEHTQQSRPSWPCEPFPPLQGDPQGLRHVFLLVLLQCQFFFFCKSVCTNPEKCHPFAISTPECQLVYWADNTEEKHAWTWQSWVDVTETRERVLIYFFENV